MVLTEKAYAKINLYLDVVGKRPDGFHNLETLMHTVSLSDELTFELLKREPFSIELKIEGNDNLKADESNLVFRAVKEFVKHSHVDGKLIITLKKNIPVEAGLGGGSADAAATLRALNRLSKFPLDETKLYEMAEKLGSDVPFCLKGGFALCRGRGEKITPLSPLKNLHLVIINSGERVSTPDAFKLIDQSKNSELQASPNEKYNVLSSITEGEMNALFNAFEQYILPTCPRAKKAKEELILCGAYSALMSGSGPTVFGIFDDFVKAENAAKKLQSDFDKVFVSGFID